MSAHAAAERPLRGLTDQGWEVRQYYPVLGPNGVIEHAFHLTRQRDHKLLVVRRKMMGKELYSEELDD